MKAFVLINTEIGREPDVISSLKGAPGIVAVYSLYGIYDILIEVEAEDMEKIKQVVFNTIRRLENVKSTITLITYDNPVTNP